MNNVYESPLSSRYASKEMLYNFSSDMKFSTWRRLHQLRRRLLPSGQVFRRRAEGYPPQKRGVHLADAFFRHSKAPFAGIIGFVPIMPRGGPYRKNKSRKNTG